MHEKYQYTTRLYHAMREKNIREETIGKAVQYAVALLDQSLPVIFDRQHLGIILKMRGVKAKYYNKFKIPKKRTGEYRLITAPSKKMKARHRWILQNILMKIPTSEYCHGFSSGLSIVTNAGMHLSKKFVLNLDIKDFFPSITKTMVYSVFVKTGYAKEVAELLSDLCTYEGCLPQGAPTSPCLSNIICYALDMEIAQLAVSNDATYTRYADDITISSDANPEILIEQITVILQKYGFTVNQTKTRIYHDPQRKIVTGLIVTDHVSIPKRFKRKLRQEIYYCQKFGVSTHLANIKAKKSVNYREHLYGKAYYVKMVEPDLGNKLLKELDKIYWG